MREGAIIASDGNNMDEQWIEITNVDAGID